MDITRIAYEKYKLRWMIDHECTLADLISELDVMQEEFSDCTVSQMFADWEFGYGFASEIWACYEEFMENEFLNKDYMMSILTPCERYEYICYMQKGK